MKHRPNYLNFLCDLCDHCGKPFFRVHGKRAKKGVFITTELDFICDEVEYVMGRFTPEDITKYIGARRIGRGIAPRVDQATRQLIISNVISHYAAWKAKNNLMDWNDLAKHPSEIFGRPLRSLFVPTSAAKKAAFR